MIWYLALPVLLLLVYLCKTYRCRKLETPLGSNVLVVVGCGVLHPLVLLLPCNRNIPFVIISGMFLKTGCQLTGHTYGLQLHFQVSHLKNNFSKTHA